MPDPFQSTAPTAVSSADEQIFPQRLRRGMIGLMLGFGAPALILIGVVIYLIRAAAWVDQTEQVMSDVREIEKRLVELETGTRGFQLTGEEQFLVDAEAGRAAVRARLDSLKQRVAANASEKQAEEILRRDVSAWLRFADEVLLARRQGAPGMVSVAENLRGKAMMDAIRARLEGMYHFERELRTTRVQFLRDFRVTVLSLLALLGLAGAPIAAWWLRQFVRQLSASYRRTVADAEQRASELKVTLRSIGDAVVATNATGEVVFLNRVAERLTGWASAEAHGRPLAEIFSIFNEETGAPAENPVSRVLRERTIVGLANHTVLRARDGRETPIEDSAAPILSDTGEIHGVILVFHDVGERRAGEKALRESEARFRFLNLVGETTRSLEEPAAIMAAVAELLGRHLRVSRCAYADVAADGEEFTIRHDFTNGCASTVGTYRLEHFGVRAEDAMRAGRTLVIRDVDAELEEVGGAMMFDSLGVKATICCPLIKDGRLRAMMAVHQTSPRAWTAVEISLVEEVVERCWAIIERARAEAEVLERARLSALRLEIAGLLASGEPLDEVLQGCCEALVRHLDAAFARIWTLNTFRANPRAASERGALHASRWTARASASGRV